MNKYSETLALLHSEITTKNVCLVAVSKTYPVMDIKQVYDLGVRDFGENKVQELLSKKDLLPNDIQWHLIGHLQTNKVKQIADFVYLIHSVDSEKLLDEINKQGAKCNRIINILLQMYIAQEETKFGLDKEELLELVKKLPQWQNINLRGLMGMASNSEEEELVRKEFKTLKACFNEIKKNILPNKADFDTVSMGMSGDYKWAIEEGSNMVRIGSVLFGKRNYQNQ